MLGHGIAQVEQALDKVAEAADKTRPLHSEEFVDDLALTSMARLWDVGKSEPIKVRAPFVPPVWPPCDPAAEHPRASPESTTPLTAGWQGIAHRWHPAGLDLLHRPLRR